MALFSRDALSSLRRASKSRSRTRKQNLDSKTLCIIPEDAEEQEPRSSTSSLPTTPPPPSRQHSTRTLPRKPDARVTLSAYTFSIDDALLLVTEQDDDSNCDSPRSLALSFDIPHPFATPSSSSSDSSCLSDSPRSISSDLSATPPTSDDEDCDSLHASGPRLVTPIRPLCITKLKAFDVRSEVVRIEQPEYTEFEVPVKEEQDEEEDYDFYTRQFEDIIALSSPLPPSFPTASLSTSRSRPDSFIRPHSPTLAALEGAVSSSQERSRMSKPLPSLPPSPTPILPPSVPHALSLSQRPRRKRGIPPMPLRAPPPPTPLPSPPALSPCLDLSRAPPRMPIPDDIFFDDFEGDLLNSDDMEIHVELASEDGNIGIAYSDEDHVFGLNTPNEFGRESDSGAERELAFPMTPSDGMYAQTYPSNASPRSSLDSYVPHSCESFFPLSSDLASSDNHERYSTDSHADEDSYEPSHALRSRWSSSTLASIEQSHARSHASHAKTPSMALAFGAAKLKGVFASRKAGKEGIRVPSPRVPRVAMDLKDTKSHRIPWHNDFVPVRRDDAPQHLVPNASFVASPRSSRFSPPSSVYMRSSPSPNSFTSLKTVRRHRSQSSTSTASSFSACNSVSGSDAGSDMGGSGNGLRRKPIPVEMFLRA